MRRLQTNRRVPDAARDPFRVILPALHSDYDELRRIFRFELPQLRKHMNAVYSAIGPEIEKHHFPSEISEVELLVLRCVSSRGCRESPALLLMVWE